MGARGIEEFVQKATETIAFSPLSSRLIPIQESTFGIIRKRRASSGISQPPSR
jgi:hypothetical protein